MARSSATLQKVADSVGVSVSTVSRILSSPNFAKKETRDSVLATAARLGYGRKRRETTQDGKLTGSAESIDCGLKKVVLLSHEPIFGGVRSPDWIFCDVVPTLQRIGRELGFQLVMSSYGGEIDRDALLKATEDACGVLWMACGEEEDMPAILAQRLPVVVMNDDSLWPPQWSVMGDNRMVIFKAIEHLYKLGHRRVAYFEADESPHKESVHIRERLAAYFDAITYFKMEADRSLSIRECFGVNGHPQAVAHAMDRLQAMKSRPSALISPLCYAIQFLKETRKRSISVPNDLSIVAIDNAPVAELVDPPLTVIDCVFARCAEMAIQLLIEKKKNPDDRAKTVLMEPRLIVRNSSAQFDQ
jgi:DNA-binding LacI/PurR family transcriptional regulator